MDITNLAAYLESAETESAIADSIRANLVFYQSIDTGEKADQFTGTIYNWFVKECVKRNQYLIFTRQAYDGIFEVYRALVQRLRAIDGNQDDGAEILAIVRNHRKKLLDSIRPVKGLDVTYDTIIPCAEYSTVLQMRILRLERETMAEPVLDIGCGAQAGLVIGLKKSGMQVTGIDQYIPETGIGCILRRNWLEFEYRPRSWGTIVSHMAFSNHFRHVLTGNPSLADTYQRVFDSILEALKSGGVFCYSPALPSVEANVDRSRYRVESFENIPGCAELNTTKITRLGLEGMVPEGKTLQKVVLPG